MREKELSSYGDSVDAEINIISKQLSDIADKYRVESMTEIIKRGFNIHDVIKCELFIIGSNLGYISLPEFTIVDNEVKKRFDMVWIKNNKIVYIFELQNVTKVLFLDRILRLLGRPIFLNIRVDKTFKLTIDDLLGYGWIREVLDSGRLLKLPFKWEFRVGDILKIAIENGELIFYKVDEMINNRCLYISVIGTSFKPMIQIPTLLNLKRGDVIEMRKFDENAFVARLGFTPDSDRSDICLLDVIKDKTSIVVCLGGWSGSALVEQNTCNIKFEEAV